ncbi:TonB-dependent siderophore receptor [Aquimarina aquimarini]|uniref:TonB-dependent siderophore receptor n=1 Tax=Aquimarina aquimarini TaxID=1191734 RepID=UPI000D55E13E|nr:TonB-dependent siderophore receptor [Aquimarina aquimarini]
MKQIYIYVLMLFGILTINAQTTITGVVTNEQGEPLESVSVLLQGTTNGTITTIEGKYTLQNIANGSYNLEISSIGYTTYVKEIEVNDSTLVINTQLFTSEEELQLVEIIGRRNTDYKADITFAGTRTGANVKEIPQSIAVINKEVIKDQGIFRLNEVTENVAGVTRTRAGNNFTSRGFRVSHDYINGNRALLAPDFSASAIATQYERIEFIKGPAAALFGNSSPGGVVNAVTKKPLKENRADASVSYGSFDTRRATLDITGPLNADKTLLYRTNVAWEHTETFVDFQKTRSILFAPSLSYLPSEKTRFNVDIIGTINNDDAGIYRGTPVLQNDIFAVPINFNAAEPYDYRQNNSILLTASGSHKFSDAISLNGSYTRSDFNQNFLETRSANRFTDDGTELIRQIINRDTKGASDFVTFYLAGKFKTAGIKHEAVLGWDYYKTSQKRIDRFALGEANGVPNLRFNNRIPIQELTELSVNFAENVSGGIDLINQSRGVYLQDLITIGKFKILAALRYENLDQSGLVRDAIDLTDNLDNDIFLPRLGLTYKVNDQINVFASYTEAFQPQQFPIGVTNVNDGEVFDPFTSDQIEFGTKTTFFNNKLLGQLSFYSINREGRLIEDPNSNPAFIQLLQLGKEVSRGLELDITGKIVSNFTLTANYAFNEVEILDDNPEVRQLGLDDNNPQHTAGLWGKYTVTNGFLKNLGIGLGGRFVSKSRISTRAVNPISEVITFPSYATARAGIFYKYQNIDLTFNVNNIFDERYFIGGIDEGRVFAGAPRNFLITLGYSF